MPEFKELSKDVERILYSEEVIETMIRRLGAEITESYREDVKKHKLILIGVLKGSFIFMADLIRHVELPCEVLFLRASSYGGGTFTSGKVNLSMLPEKDVLKDADILLIEDILDSGKTLERLSEVFRDCGAHSVKICTMLDKPARRVAAVQSDFCGFEVEDEFLVGYGLDYNETYRNLPYIGVLKREIYS